MGAWRYCWRCNAPMDAPTIADVARGYQECTSPGCNAHHEPDEFERTQAAVYLCEKVQRLELIVEQLVNLCRKAGHEINEELP